MRKPFDEIFDELIRWYKDGGEAKLPPELADIKLKWMQIRDYFLTHKPKHDGEVVAHFSIDWKLSDATIYHHVAMAKRFYAHMDSAVVGFDKIVLIAQIKELRQTSMNAGKYAVAAQCDKNLIALGGYDLPKAGGEGGPTTIEVHLDFNPALVGSTRNPNLLAQVSKLIGEKRARRELLMAEDLDGLVEDVAHQDVAGDVPPAEQP